MVHDVKKRQHAVNVGRGGLTPAGGALSALVVRILRLGERLNAAGDALARPAGQTSARWRVLAAIEEAPATVAQIAREFELARQSVQRIADALAREGLASFEDNPEHQRARLLRLTGDGQRALRKIQGAQRAWANALAAEIGKGPLVQASEVVDKLLLAMSQS